MTFTDDDVSRLRMSIDPSAHLSREKIFALLSRLEAAEIIVKHVISKCPIVSNEMYAEIVTWCKSGGAESEDITAKPFHPKGRKAAGK